MATKRVSRPNVRKVAPRPRKSQTVGKSIIEGLEQAIAWTRGVNDNVRVTLVHVPEVDVRTVSNTRVGASGRDRPCSQLRSVAGRKPNFVANSA